MSKELDALKEIEAFLKENPYFDEKIEMPLIKNIETALKDYEQLKINYSELEDVNAFYTCTCKDKLRALEIIKENLEFYFDDENTTISMKRKNTVFMRIVLFFENKEEYELLKEILTDE